MKKEKIFFNIMDGLTIDRIFKHCAVTKPFYKGIYSIDTIPNKSYNEPNFYVLNTDISTGRGLHWLLIFNINSKYTEIFDSLGQSPYAYGSHFKQYLTNNKKRTFIYTNKRLQNLKSNVCGCHVLFVGYKKCQKKLSLNSLLNRYYLNDRNFNDCNVLCFCKKQFKLKPTIIKHMLQTCSKCKLDNCA